MKSKIVVCASGEGTNFAAIVQASRRGDLHAEVVGLITNRRKIGAIARAQELGVPFHVLAPRDFSTRAEWDKAFAEQLHELQAEWVVLAGFLVKIESAVLLRYSGRIVNSHPSLLPKYGGAGMYGDLVHQAVIRAQEVESGITIHLVDSHYDEGPILAQQSVPVLPLDTAAQLAARIKACEVQLYPRVLNDLVTGRITSR